MSGSTARRPIRRLSREVIERIAAGEVVDRPASVVKELVENAFDADARRVDVAIEDGGIARIVVEDDGEGIPAAELALAIERHATSKVTRAEDLERVGTLGFRGEALAAIAQAGRLTIRSRARGEEGARALLADGGRLEELGMVGRDFGTTVQVESLFHATPARRKFLRRPAAEAVEVARTIERLHLSRPGTALSLTVDGHRVGSYPATADHAEAATQLFGPEFHDRALPVRDTGPDRLRIDGVVAQPSLNRPTSGGVHLLVGGRPVSSRALLEAVRAAYREFLPKGRFPVGVLWLQLDPALVDVNVHPQKREVRFAHEREVADALRRAVARALRAGPGTAEPPQVAGVPGGAGLEGGPSLPAAPRPPEPESLGLPARPGVQRRLLEPGAAPPLEGPGGVGPVVLLGCLDLLYWLGRGEHGELLLIDQHAASERLLFERLRRHTRLARQELMQPVRLTLSPRQASALEAFGVEVEAAGFTVEPFGGAAYRISSVPAHDGLRARAEGLLALLDELSEGGRPTVPDEAADRRRASMACHAAIRAGDAVNAETMARVLGGLRRETENAYACPHGRPIFVRLSRARIDGWFGRAGGVSGDPPA